MQGRNEVLSLEGLKWRRAGLLESGVILEVELAGLLQSLKENKEPGGCKVWVLS